MLRLFGVLIFLGCLGTKICSPSLVLAQPDLRKSWHEFSEIEKRERKVYEHERELIGRLNPNWFFALFINEQQSQKQILKEASQSHEKANRLLFELSRSLRLYGARNPLSLQTLTKLLVIAQKKKPFDQEVFWELLYHSQLKNQYGKAKSKILYFLKKDLKAPAQSQSSEVDFQLISFFLNSMNRGAVPSYFDLLFKRLLNHIKRKQAWKISRLMLVRFGYAPLYQDDFIRWRTELIEKLFQKWPEETRQHSLEMVRLWPIKDFSSYKLVEKDFVILLPQLSKEEADFIFTRLVQAKMYSQSWGGLSLLKKRDFIRVLSKASLTEENVKRVPSSFYDSFFDLYFKQEFGFKEFSFFIKSLKLKEFPEKLVLKYSENLERACREGRFLVSDFCANSFAPFLIKTYRKVMNFDEEEQPNKKFILKAIEELLETIVIFNGNHLQINLEGLFCEKKDWLKKWEELKEFLLELKNHSFTIHNVKVYNQEESFLFEKMNVQFLPCSVSSVKEDLNRKKTSYHFIETSRLRLSYLFEKERFKDLQSDSPSLSLCYNLNQLEREQTIQASFLKQHVNILSHFLRYFKQEITKKINQNEYSLSAKEEKILNFSLTEKKRKLNRTFIRAYSSKNTPNGFARVCQSLGEALQCQINSSLFAECTEGFEYFIGWENSFFGNEL